MRPSLIQSARDAADAVSAARRPGRTVGIVPTMGALHAGHLSLARAARARCDSVVVTIFVNPTQFGPREDFARYPRDLEHDLDLLAQEQVDFVFAPDLLEIYPPGYSTYVEPGTVAELWEGACRPGHFRGVCTVVLKLFHILPADLAFFGRKDYQQVQVIRQMVADLNLGIQIVVEDTIRDVDGLALSSRNAYLSMEQRQRALAIPAAWQSAQRNFSQGVNDPAILEAAMHKILLDAPIDHIDYAVCVHPNSLHRVTVAEPDSVLLLAVKVGATRLIDNATLGGATP